MSIRGLEALDGRALDALEFCARAYAIFDAVRNAPGGISELRLRSSPRAKRLMEEILPIASYVQAKHGAALRIRVTWHGGNQNYDAFVQSAGARAERGEVRERYYLEVTTAGHQNDYLVRENVDSTGGSFAPKRTKRVPGTKRIVSEPSVYSNHEREIEAIDHIDKIVAKKRRKDYPTPTVLLVQCSIFSPVLDDEWDYVVTTLSGNREYRPFKEVYILEPNTPRLALVHSSPIRRRRPASRSSRSLRAARSGAA